METVVLKEEMLLKELRGVENILIEYFLFEKRDLLTFETIEKSIDKLTFIYKEISECDDFTLFQKRHIQEHIYKYYSWLNKIKPRSKALSEGLAPVFS